MSDMHANTSSEHHCKYDGGFLLEESFAKQKRHRKLDQPELSANSHEEISITQG